MAARVIPVWASSIRSNSNSIGERYSSSSSSSSFSFVSAGYGAPHFPALSASYNPPPPRFHPQGPAILSVKPQRGFCVLACLPPSASPKTTFNASTKLYVSGLSFRTTEEGLRNAFQNFGQLREVNLVMDRIANRPRGFAFLRYATEEESKKAIEGMHGKFLDGRVIFVEAAKPRSELRQDLKQNPRQQ